MIYRAFQPFWIWVVSIKWALKKHELYPSDRMTHKAFDSSAINNTYIGLTWHPRSYASKRCEGLVSYRLSKSQHLTADCLSDLIGPTGKRDTEKKEKIERKNLGNKRPAVCRKNTA